MYYIFNMERSSQAELERMSNATFQVIAFYCQLKPESKRFREYSEKYL